MILHMKSRQVTDVNPESSLSVTDIDHILLVDGDLPIRSFTVCQQNKVSYTLISGCLSALSLFLFIDLLSYVSSVSLIMGWH